MAPRTERDRRRDQTARLPGRWRNLGGVDRAYNRQRDGSSIADDLDACPDRSAKAGAR